MVLVAVDLSVIVNISHKVRNKGLASVTMLCIQNQRLCIMILLETFTIVPDSSLLYIWEGPLPTNVRSLATRRITAVSCGVSRSGYSMIISHLYA